MAIRDLHRQKGTLLAYNQIALSESPWRSPAYVDAYQQGRFFRPCLTPDCVEAPCPVSRGPFDPSAPAPSTAIPIEVLPPASSAEPAPQPAPVISDPQASSSETAMNALNSISVGGNGPVRLPAPAPNPPIQQVSY
ncbi:MAG: hypothetical protein R3C05_12725 [Pirellulaceae bacterium]